MASSAWPADVRASGGFALGVSARAMAIALLVFAAIAAASNHLYATALVPACVAALVGVDLARSASTADRLMAQFVEAVASRGDDRPAPQPGAQALSAAIERALEQERRARAESQKRVDFAEALADNVASALLVVNGSGAVVSANRSARLAFGESAGQLSHLPRIGPAAAARLLALPPGARDVVALADEQSMLASVTSFSAGAGAPLRLIALQGVPGQLDVVVLKAWQDLVRVLAHEMMNSLTPICSLSDSIARELRRPEGDGTPRCELAEVVEVIGRRGAGLIDFVERYRRLAELPPVARAPIDLSAFAFRLERLMSALMEEAGAGFTTDVYPAGLVVQADAALLEQAVINLLKNARDAVAGRPGAMVRFVARRDDDGAVLIVEDNGPGLAGDVERAFVPFFTTKDGGSGIGLSLARQIALAHGGSLEHARREPNGSSFWLSLPAGVKQ